jgi:hypothetical protein
LRRLLILALVLPVQLAAQAPRIPNAVQVDRAHAEVYRADYARVVACTGLERSFEALTWFIVPGGSFRDKVQESMGEQKIRYWGETILAGRDTIFLAEVRPEWVVRHELIHYVRQEIDHDEMLNHKCQAPLNQKILDDEERARLKTLPHVASRE